MVGFSFVHWLIVSSAFLGAIGLVSGFVGPSTPLLLALVSGVLLLPK